MKRLFFFLLVTCTIFSSCKDQLQNEIAENEQENSITENDGFLIMKSKLQERLEINSSNRRGLLNQLPELDDYIEIFDEKFNSTSWTFLIESMDSSSFFNIVVKKVDNIYFGFILNYKLQDGIVVDRYDLDGNLLLSSSLNETYSSPNVSSRLQSGLCVVGIRTYVIQIPVVSSTTGLFLPGEFTSQVIFENIYGDCGTSGSGSTGGSFFGGNNDFYDDSELIVGRDGELNPVLLPSRTSVEEFYESILSQINLTPEQRREIQLNYIQSFGGQDGAEFKSMIEELLSIQGITVGDVSEINLLVDKFYLNVKGQYIMAIFSPSNMGLILGLALTGPISAPMRNASSGVIARYTSRSLGQGYSTMDAFKKVHGHAETGYNWHHIVSQRSSNIAKFGANQIHNTKNLIKLPSGSGSWHQRITNFYNSKPTNINTDGLRFGEWVAQKSFQEQMEWGLKIMQLMK